MQRTICAHLSFSAFHDFVIYKENYLKRIIWKRHETDLIVFEHEIRTNLLS